MLGTTPDEDERDQRDTDIRDEARGLSCKKQDKALLKHLETFYACNREVLEIDQWTTDEMVKINVGK
jgi:hypothetical protein